MGIITGGQEQAAQVISSSFSGTGNSNSAAFYGPFSVAVWGTFSGTVQLQKSFDGGTTWIPAGTDVVGALASYTAPVACRVIESELGVYYRLACTAYTSGTINYRLSASVPRTSDTTN